ncbi:MAG: hypothetical protein AB8U44_02510 [Aaplasma endosymbiont of Hyalomma asiaticum]
MASGLHLAGDCGSAVGRETQVLGSVYCVAERCASGRCYLKRKHGIERKTQSEVLNR